ncbi:uncharacterized protein LOC123203960 [Mangifera indica]|uniref:uncharacterized protein LOC123203960 n=1 Tax=Mangifera indica TaxID=29780 RepID=UPI001CFB982E|nr:uncharacterized protein LOC123203960 [Mangifera indica]
MEGSSSNPYYSNQTASGASDFLTNLPSRGLFSSNVISSNPGSMRVYVCEHDTSPPANQLVKTNQQNILIRSLTLKKQKDASSKDVKGVAGADKKRAAERVLDGRNPAKRANMQASSRQEGMNSCAAEKDFHSLTVERLRALLKERGLSPKGKKDDLVARLKGANS